MTTFLTILLVLASIILIVAVLVQPAKAGGLSPLGGSSQSVFGSTGGTTFLFRLTMWTAAFIMVVCLWMTRSNIQEGKQSVLDSVPMTNQGTNNQGKTVPMTPAQQAPATPTTPTHP
jgi:preprotein translocase subunit SecG